MEEFNNEELNQEVIENEVIPVDDNVEVVNLEPEEKDYTVQLIAAGAAIFAASGYGAVRTAGCLCSHECSEGEYQILCTG